MEVVIEMTLPRNARSAPLARRTLDASLSGLGVTGEIRADIALALGEACANVIRHANAGDEYEVHAHLDDRVCIVEVIDGGQCSADPSTWDRGCAPLGAEHGRGLQLIRAFTEELRIGPRPHAPGSVVHFEKSLIAS
ncbi:MAG: ATP-binding protein [Actinomadura rubrobrunea]|nr:ATP-binding protein [Actinomadura rubrobrunea]